MKTKILLTILLMGASAQARVFDLNKESFASYLNLGYSQLALRQDAYAAESTATQFSETVATSQGGEFGFLYASRALTWRFGFEIVQPKAVSNVVASNGTTDLYKMSSTVTAFIPKLGLEFNLRNSGGYRSFVFANVGSASVTVQNDYTNVTISPTADFSTTYKGTGTQMQGGLGFEFGAFDTTSLLLELGYRDLVFQKLTYGKDTTSSFSGAHNAGDAVTRTDGNNRELNFRGVTLVLGLRFWLF